MEELTRAFGRVNIRRSVYSSSDESSESSDNERDRKKFGYFRCGKCNREWQSAHSWRDFGQKCQKCGTNVKPYQRENLIASNKIDPNKPHQRSMCEKCKLVGDCTKRY